MPLNYYYIIVDASKAGEGQLEISINDGDVPNAVQVHIHHFLRLSLSHKL